jgi:hypothetical protein
MREGIAAVGTGRRHLGARMQPRLVWLRASPVDDGRDHSERDRGCGPPELRDTGLHTTLRLYRSMYRPQADTARAYRAVGDYTVEPRGRYGEGEDEGLRVDCTRLRAIGVVRLGVGHPPPGSSAMARARAPWAS